MRENIMDKQELVDLLLSVKKTLIEDNGLYFSDEDMTTFSVLKYNNEIDKLDQVIEKIINGDD